MLYIYAAICTALWKQLVLKFASPYGNDNDFLAARTCTLTADPWKLSCGNACTVANVTITIMLPRGHCIPISISTMVPWYAQYYTPIIYIYIYRERE